MALKVMALKVMALAPRHNFGAIGFVACIERADARPAQLSPSVIAIDAQGEAEGLRDLSRPFHWLLNQLQKDALHLRGLLGSWRCHVHEMITQTIAQTIAQMVAGASMASFRLH
jgi:hypothetical protein